jgi:hypothetical protein
MELVQVPVQGLAVLKFRVLPQLVPVIVLELQMKVTLNFKHGTSRKK